MKINRRIREHPRMVKTAPIQGMGKVDGDVKILLNVWPLVFGDEIEKFEETVCH